MTLDQISFGIVGLCVFGLCFVPFVVQRAVDRRISRAIRNPRRARLARAMGSADFLYVNRREETFASTPPGGDRKKTPDRYSAGMPEIGLE